MLSLHNEAVVRFSHCNFGSDNLRSIVDSLSCDTSSGTLELLYCRKIPEKLISCLIFKQNLSRLVIREYHGRGLSPDVQEKLQQRVRFLCKLEHLEIHRIHLDPSLLRTSSLRVVSLRDCSLSRVDALILIEILVKCPLERLELDNNEIPGTFEVLSRKPNVTYPHFEILFLRRVDLTREDIQGIARMINQGKLPAIQRILLDEPPLVHRELRDHLDVYNPQNTRGSFEETEKFVYRKLLSHVSKTWQKISIYNSQRNLDRDFVQCGGSIFDPLTDLLSEKMNATISFIDSLLENKNKAADAEGI